VEVAALGSVAIPPGGGFLESGSGRGAGDGAAEVLGRFIPSPLLAEQDAKRGVGAIVTGVTAENLLVVRQRDVQRQIVL
jgi:hypothetical protein